MIKTTSLMALLAIALAAPAAHAFNQEEAEAKCKQYAQEDEVKSEELADYLAACIKDMQEEEAEEKKAGERE